MRRRTCPVSDSLLGTFSTSSEILHSLFFSCHYCCDRYGVPGWTGIGHHQFVSPRPVCEAIRDRMLFLHLLPGATPTTDSQAISRVYDKGSRAWCGILRCLCMQAGLQDLRRTSWCFKALHTIHSGSGEGAQQLRDTERSHRQDPAQEIWRPMCFEEVAFGFAV